jgi:hypothetical protein
MTWLLAVLVLAVAGPFAVLALRDALLARKLPAIERKLVDLFGPGTKLTHARLDRALGVEVAGAIPIPGGLVLEVERARITGVIPVAAGRAAPDSLAVESLDGTIRIPRERGDSLRTPVTYRRSPTARPIPIDGTLTAHGAAWTHARGAGPPFDLDATIEIALDRWRIAGRATSGSASLAGEVGGPIAAGATLKVSAHLDRIPAELAAHLLALAPLDPPVLVEGAAGPGLRLPAAAIASGDVKLEAGALSVASVIESPSSRVEVALERRANGEIATSHVRGRLSFADAFAAGLVSGDVRPVGDGAAELDARIEGSTRLALAGRATSASLVLALGPRDRFPAWLLRDVAVRFRIDGEKLAWHELQATLFSGSVEGSGTVELAARRHATKLAWRGVAVHEVETAPGARGLEPALAGALAGALDVRGSGSDLASIAGEGELAIHDVEYRFLREAKEPLARFGLPEPRTKGEGPCRARIAIGEARATLDAIDGRVGGLHMKGALATTFSGELSGRVEARLQADYLAQSLLLALPVAFTGEVVIPIQAEGRLGAAVWRADIGAAIGGLLKKSKVATAVRGGMDALFRALEGPRAGPGADLDPLLDAILAGGPEGDRLLDRLIDTGISPREVEAMLSEYKKRRRR